MSGSDSDQLSQAVKNLRRKADQQTTAHACLHEYYHRLDLALTSFSLLAGVVLVAFVWVTPDAASSLLGIPSHWYQLTIGLLAILELAAVVLLLAWRPDVRASRHDQAVKHYTKMAYRASRMLVQGETLTDERLARLQQDYLDTQDLPRIPENKFLKLKQWHLLKVEASKELDKDAHTRIGRLVRSK